MGRLILDNRRILPLGSLIATKDGSNLLLLYTQGNGMPKELAVTAAGRTGNPNYFLVPDITKPIRVEEGMEVGRFDCTPDFFDGMQRNKVVNLKGFEGNPSYEKEETVVLIGGGSVKKEDIKLLERKKIPIVAVNDAIRWCKAKYWVGIDSRVSLLNCSLGARTSNVRAYLYIGAYPAVGQLGWKDIGWFDVTGGGGNGAVPKQFGTEGVINQAIQFIYRELKPKKIIMLGVQHIHPQYFWIGLTLQAICFWYSRSGACIWNCTEESTIMGGVFVGPLEKALEFRGK